MTVYKFKFHCSACEEDSQMTYMVPDVKDYGIESSVLSCKKCERPLLKIWSRPCGGMRYSIRDLFNKRWLLGGEGKEEDVSKDSFWAWVVDHGGERIAD